MATRKTFRTRTASKKSNRTAARAAETSADELRAAQNAAAARAYWAEEHPDTAPTVDVYASPYSRMLFDVCVPTTLGMEILAMIQAAGVKIIFNKGRA